MRKLQLPGMVSAGELVGHAAEWRFMRGYACEIDKYLCGCHQLRDALEFRIPCSYHENIAFVDYVSHARPQQPCDMREMFLDVSTICAHQIAW